MKIKRILFASSFFIFLFSLILFMTVLFSDDENTDFSAETFSTSALSPEVLRYKSTVEKYAKEKDLSAYVNYLLAIMEVESGGKGGDVMQCSESLGLPPNSLDTEASIKQGVNYFSDLVKAAKAQGCDIETAVQAYNFGGGFIGYVANHGKKYSEDLAAMFAKEKAGGKKVSYSNPIVAGNGNWRYAYGNQYYVQLVRQYLTGVTQKFDDKTVQAIMDEAVKYEGGPYIFGGSSPTTSFDCSGLTQWCYGKAGIRLPRTAQTQYDVTSHLPINEAKPGDLVFFHDTYAAGTFVTHVGIYVGNMRMFNAGDPIGYADLTSSYWQQHLIGAGRIRK